MQKTDKRMQLILCLVILAGCLYVFHTYLFGNDLFVFTDDGSDTKEQYLMQYNTIVNHLRAGDFSFWDFNYGLGTNLFMLNLTDPFLMLLYGAGVLFGPEHLPFYLVYYHIVKVLAAGWVCYRFLSCFPLTERVKGLCALIYAFSGYMMVWGQHYQFSTPLILYPLILWMIEKALKHARWGLGLTLSCAVSVLSSLYLSYMTLLASGIYVCMRILWTEEKGWKEGLCRLLRTAGFMLLGVGLGCVTLLPSAAVIFGVTSRVESEGSFFSRIVSMLSVYDLEYYITLIRRFLSSSFEGNGAAAAYFGIGNYYEAPNVYCTALLIILGFQYFFGLPKQACTRRQKGVQIGVILLTAVLLCIQIGSGAFNGFVAPSYRHTFVLLPVFLLMMAFTLEQIFREKRVCIPALGLAAVLLAVGYGSGMLLPLSAKLKGNLILLLAMAILMSAVLVLCGRKKEGRYKSLLYSCLCGAVLVSLLSDAASVNQGRDTLAKDADSYFDQLYHDSIQVAQAWLEEQDTEFFRTEKRFNIGSLCMDSLAQGYSGISSYNSMINGNILEFANQLWPNWLLIDNNHFFLQNVQEDTNRLTLLGVKYLLAREGDLEIPGFEKIKDFENLSVYQNQDNASVGKFYRASITQEAYEESRQELDCNKLLTSAVILEDKGAYDQSEELLVSCKREEIAGAVKKANWKISGKAEKNIPLRQKALKDYGQVTASFTIKADRDTVIDITTVEGNLYESVLQAGQDKYIEMTIPSGSKSITISFQGVPVRATVKNLQIYGSKTADQYGEEGSVRVYRQKKDSRLSGTVDSDQDGIVLLAIPYEQGWSLKVDGEETETFRADYGLTGFYSLAGSHNFVLEFTPPLLKAGIGVSLGSLAVFLVLLAWTLAARKEKTKEKI